MFHRSAAVFFFFFFYPVYSDPSCFPWCRMHLRTPRRREGRHTDETSRLCTRQVTMAAPADGRPANMNPRVNTAGFTFNLSPAQKEVRHKSQSRDAMRCGPYSLRVFCASYLCSALSCITRARAVLGSAIGTLASNRVPPARTLRSFIVAVVPQCCVSSSILLRSCGSLSSGVPCAARSKLQHQLSSLLPSFALRQS